MFCDDGKKSYRILGVYRVKSHSESMSERRRTHAAICFRIKGDSRFFYGKDGELCAHAEDNSVIYIPPYLDYHRVTGGEEERIVVQLTEYAYDSGAEAPSDTGIEIYSDKGELRPVFETLLREWENGGGTAYNRSMRILYTVFEELQKSGESDQRIPQVIVKGVRLMEKSFRDPDLKIAALAEECHISETYFRRVYSAHFGISPIEALCEMRFRYARDLLRTGYYRIKEVAELSGFTDAKYFRAAFKARFGISPRDYAESQIRTIISWSKSTIRPLSRINRVTGVS